MVSYLFVVSFLGYVGYVLGGGWFLLRSLLILVSSFLRSSCVEVGFWVGSIWDEIVWVSSVFNAFFSEGFI